MEQKQAQIICSERNTSKRAVIRSDGALYVLLLLFAFGLIMLTHVFAEKLGIRRIWLQIGLYALLLGVGYAIYRLRLVDYLYELTESELVISQAVGSRQKRIAVIPLAAIDSVGTCPEADGLQTVRACHGNRNEAMAVCYTEAGERRAALIRVSEAFKEKLTEARYARN